jgi:Fe2+ or Zn2+ uptake regulation protein
MNLISQKIEPYRESIIKVLKEQYNKDKDISLSAKEIHKRLHELKIDVQLATMYRALDRLSSYGYVSVTIDRSGEDSNRYRRIFRYNPY